MEPDIFEALRVITGSDYISDLRFPPRNAQARAALRLLDLRLFSLRTLSDAAEYLYGVKREFKTTEQAAEFFAGDSAPQEEDRLEQ